MANRTIYEIIAKAIGFGNTDKKVKGLTGSLRAMAGGLATTAAAYKGFSVAVESVRLAGQLEGVENAFNNLRKEAGFSENTFQKLDRALNGTADRMTIMEQANNAMLLGIAESDDQMAEMFDTAQRLAQAVGQDATFGIESLVTGLGRQSKLMLDNLGIIVDVDKANREYAASLGKTAKELTDAERKQAFINKALSEGKRLVEGMGKEQLTTAQTLEQLTAGYTDLKVAIGESLIDVGAVGFVEEFVTSLKGLLDIRRNEQQIIEDTAFKYGKNTSAISELENRLTFLIQKQIQLKNETFEVGTNTRIFSTNADAARDAVNNYSGFVSQNTSDMQKNKEEIINVRKEINSLIEAYSISTENNVSNTAALKENDIQMSKITSSTLEYIKATNEARKAEKEAAEEGRKNAKIKKQTNRETVAISLGALKSVGEAVGADAETQQYLTIAQALADTYAGANKAFAQGGPLGFATGAAVIAAGLANVRNINQAYKQSQAQYGFEGVVSEPTQFTVGEQGQSEFVSVTPLEGVNNATAGGITVNIQGNLMTSEYIETELAEQVSEAIRRGVSFA
tara:strand:- start:3188 stop:4891 length:1704 start_codon:yes stop_codon:yes gene_type:complete